MMRKYSLIFLVVMGLLLAGIWGWKRGQSLEEQRITWNADTDKIAKVICENSCFSKKRVVVANAEEIRTIVLGLKALPLEYDTGRQRKQKNSDGGYSQLLLFCDEEENVVDCMGLESSTEILYSYKGRSYRGNISPDSELSDLLSDLVAEYWADPGERTGRWDENESDTK